MADLDLDAIRGRAEAATPGPWSASHRHVHHTADDDEKAGLGLEIEGPPGASMRGQFALGADAQFIAHAREDVPALLAEVERQRAALYRISAYQTMGVEFLRDEARRALEGG